MTEIPEKHLLSQAARDTRANSVGWLVQTLSGRMLRKMKARLGDEGLTPDQFVILMMLAEFEGMNQSELGRRVDLAGYTVTRALDALEARGLIERQPDPASRRAHLVSLTRDGRGLMPRVFEIVSEQNAMLLAPLRDGDREDFVQLLGKLVAADQAANAAS